ncbi:uncharacterized protein QC761_106990 [Podospora bellae-mahoneyi]|uniref:Uncharacterized protein n=1 Tax=Podospora bellae-mahoneyi TaxID=2093777 RepID=A0ABR0FYD5_9PEZI|nr:hypothetical protein QC761_106990 [Podospora bellae-mahoneyi]
MGLIHYQAAPSEPSLRLTHQPHTNRPTRGPTINLPAPLTPPCGRLLGQQLPSMAGGSLGDCCLSSLPALLTGVVFFLFLPATTFTTIPRVLDLEEQQPTDKQLSLISTKESLSGKTQKPNAKMLSTHPHRKGNRAQRRGLRQGLQDQGAGGGEGGDPARAAEVDLWGETNGRRQNR